MVFILLLIILLSSTCFSRDGALTGERHQTLQTKIIYATHYSGTIHTLALTHHENGTYSLTETSVVRSRVLRPSWITFDRIERVLYCSDEFGVADSDSSTVDDLIAYSASQDGKLSEIAAVRGMGGVHSVIYGDGRKYLGVANYHKSTLSTTSLPLASSEEGKIQIQTLNFTSSMPHPGPNPIRQERPHPHQIVLDPTGVFLLVPDLGADRVRVLGVQRDTGMLHVCEDSDGVVEAGSGPRHAVFLSSAFASGSGYGYGDSSQVRFSESGPAHGSRSRSGFQHSYAETLLLANELTNTLSLIQVSYSNSSKETNPTLHKTRTIPLNVPNTNTSLAEIQVVNNFIYVSLRGDQSYAPNDSIAMLDLNLDRDGNAGMRVEELFSAYGAGPRSFVVDQTGGLAAVGNQASSSVVVLRRHPVTGRLGEMVAGLQIKGYENDNNASEVDGISCVVWDE